MPGRFGRVLTAMATPFDRDGNLDAAGAQRLARHLLDHGTDTLVVAGTTGESPTLTADEKVRLWTAVVEAAGDGARVMAGTSTYSTAESLELTRLAEKAGVGSLLLVTPYYNKPPQAGLVAHFSAIAAATGLDCMLYNIPGRTACTIEVATMVRLFEAHPNVVAVKDAVGDMAAATRLYRETGGAMEQYSGDDKNLLPLLSVGGVGVVSVAAHLVGPAIQDLVAAFERGDTRAALDLHVRHLALFEGLFATSSPILLKAGLALLGLPAGPLRPPLVDPTAEQVEFVRGLLADVGLPPAAGGPGSAAEAGRERSGGQERSDGEERSGQERSGGRAEVPGEPGPGAPLDRQGAPVDQTGVQVVPSGVRVDQVGGPAGRVGEARG